MKNGLVALGRAFSVAADAIESPTNGSVGVISGLVDAFAEFVNGCGPDDMALVKIVTVGIQAAVDRACRDCRS